MNMVALWVVLTNTAPVDFWHSVGVCTGLEVTVTFIVNPSSNFIFITELFSFIWGFDFRSRAELRFGSDPLNRNR